MNTLDLDGPGLLERYRRDRDERALEGLIQRYGRLIYSVARRRSGEPKWADDIAQSVFVRLAASPPEVRSNGELLGWFHTTTVRAAVDLWRSEKRRQAREQVVDPVLSNEIHGAPPAWERVAPLLDDALAELRATDREVLLLRFFQEKPMRDVGDALGIGEDAAKMRVGRALGRLRAILLARGVGSTAAALAGLLEQHALEEGFAVPAGLGGLLVAQSGAPLLGATSALSGLATSSVGWAMVALATVAVGAGLFVSRMHRDDRSDAGNVGSRIPTGLGGVETPSDSAEAGPILSKLGQAESAANDGESEDLAEAERGLRKLLDRPPAATRFPPRELVDALKRFRNRTDRALPIVVERATNQDYETRAWSVSAISQLLGGLRHPQGGNVRWEDYGRAVEMSLPALLSIFANESEAEILRTMSVNALFPRATPSSGEGREALSLAGPVVDAVLGVFRNRASDGGGYRYTVADAVGLSLSAEDPAWEHLVAGVGELLESENSVDRRTAAYALSQWPGPKPASVKRILLRDLSERSTHSYRSARALGALGADARDAAPALLTYAERAEADGLSVYSRAALEVACQLEPSLRARYPEIDAGLRSNESARLPVSLVDWAIELASQDVSHLERTVIASLEGSAAGSDLDREVGRDHLVQKLEMELTTVSDDQRPSLARAIARVRELKLPKVQSPESREKLPVTDLCLTARVLLTDEPRPKTMELETSLEPFGKGGGDSQWVTPESFERLSRALGGIDPEFEKIWRKQVRKEFPWLDRLIPGFGREL